LMDWAHKQRPSFDHLSPRKARSLGLGANSNTAIRRFQCCLPGRVNAIDSGRFAPRR
jgi:hypothetical protein